MQKRFTDYSLPYGRAVLNIMKLTTLHLAIVLAATSSVIAHGGYAQEILNREVSVELKDVSLKDALVEIGRASDVKFVYSPDQLPLNERVTVTATRKKLSEILTDLLAPYSIVYAVQNDQSHIILTREKTRHEQTQVNSIPETGQPTLYIYITGTVTDAATKEALPGVSIIVKGTANGVVTDAEGKYAIEANEGDVLVFSFISYRSFEVTVGSQTTLDVSLESEAKALDEVVINAGYYDVSDKERTGNIVRIEAKDIEKQPVQNALSALQGRVPGLEITQQTGVPGGNFQVRIRGTNSIANGNDPLYIIDGVPYTSTSMAFAVSSQEIFLNGTSPLNAINPSDIESIEVLKDADATAIYGSRGSNGVILITTKKGQSGKTKIDFNFYAGAGKVASKMNLLNRSQYLKMRREAFANDNIVPDNTNAPDLTVWDTTRYTDWQRELLGGTAQTIDAQLSSSGGDKYTQFTFGGGYHEEGTVFPGNSSDRRISAHIGLNNLSRNEKLRTSLSIKYSGNDTDLIKRDLTTRALTLSPVAPALYTDSGELNWEPDEWSQNIPNPLAYTKQGYEGKTKNLLANAVVGYTIIQNLEVKASIGYSDVSMNAVTTTPKSSLAPAVAATQPNESVFSNSTFRNWTVEPQINWKPKLGEGRFDVLIGTTFLEQRQEGYAQIARGFTSEALMKNIGASSSRTLASNYYNLYRYHAIFGRVNYVYKERYIINLTGRRDGSSRFGSGNQFATFGAFGAAWIFSEEGFVKNNIPFLSLGKLRGSYGITGNDQLTDYQYLDTYTSSGPYLGVVGLTPVRLANPEFAWETNKKLEAGLELGFLNNRISSSVSYYRNRSSNQLVGFALPPTTGFNTIQGNLPAKVQNTGIEIVLSSTNVERTNLSWTTSFNLTIPRNKLIEFPNLETSPTYADRLIVGKPLTIVKRYDYLGVDAQTGAYQFKDVNDDGSINSLDLQAIRFIGQKYYGGLSNTFSFKGFQLDILFQFVNQTNGNYLDVFGLTPGNGTSNQPSWVTDRWQNEGDASGTQMFTTSATAQNAYSNLTSSTKSISDASFVRLKNLAISYSLPKEWTQKIYVANARVFIQGQNLLTFTNYRGLDPETGSTRLPPLRILTGGFHLTF